MQINKDWICLAGDDYWNSNPHSRYHIAKEFSKNGKVLWVNSIGHRFPSLKRKKGWQLIIRKLKSYLRYFRKPEKNFYVLSPLTLPVYNKIMNRFNAYFLWFQIKCIAFLVGIKCKYYFISSPSFGILDKKLNKAFVIYYYSDMYISFRELKNTKYLEELDRRLLLISKLVYGASLQICENVKKKGFIINYLPHAVDISHFQIKEEFIPENMKNIKHPIIGYYGTLTDSNDWNIIDYCSELRPEYNFVFIGEKLISIPELEKRKNIFFLGKVPYNLIPFYGKQFDVAIMFWIIREWIKNSSPLKLLEYFALGKPVVSVDIPEVKERFGNIVYLAKTREEFLNYLDLALKENIENKKKIYNEILLNVSWEKVVETIYKDINRIEYVE